MKLITIHWFEQDKELQLAAWIIILLFLSLYGIIACHFSNNIYQFGSCWNNNLALLPSDASRASNFLNNWALPTKYLSAAP